MNDYFDLMAKRRAGDEQWAAMTEEQRKVARRCAKTVLFEHAYKGWGAASAHPALNFWRQAFNAELQLAKFNLKLPEHLEEQGLEIKHVHEDTLIIGKRK